MALIQIYERPGGPDGTNAVVRFNNGPEYHVLVQNPFTDGQEQVLAWYFEEHLRFPFGGQVQAREAAASIITYGKRLFEQVFGDRRVYSAYRECVKQGLPALQLEIAGSPTFHALHWEALKDPDMAHPFALDATIVRKNLIPVPLEATIRSSPTINILVVTARPRGIRDVSYRTISLPMVEALRQASIPVEIDLVRPGTYEALDRHLQKMTNQHGVGYYHVIHFDVHGATLTYDEFRQGQRANQYLYRDRAYQERYGYDRPDIQPYSGEKAFLFLEAPEKEKADPVEATELAHLLQVHQIPVALLNACQSGKETVQGEDSGNRNEHGQSLGSHLIQAGIQIVLAMSYSVTVSAARSFMQTAYRHLFDGDEITIAIRSARQALANRKGRDAYYDQQIDLEDWLLPVVYQNQQMQLRVHPFTPDGARSYYKQQATRYEVPITTYGFVGRDMDVLEIERRLLTKRNILLVRGMGGAGKTTLLHHLASWWQTTHLVKQVFYFVYDKPTWSHQYILDTIAKQVLNQEEYDHYFQPFSLEEQQAMLCQRLRAEPHLLILDNLESITDMRLAIPNPLTHEELKALRHLLADLVGGRTLILLGSRSDETWLATETFAENLYELAGLDEEAASALTERILRRHSATKYRQSEDLLHLLRLLNGYPLALEVVLANLSRKNPSEVLAALQAGDVTLDASMNTKRPLDKTESLLSCIDYSYSNLSTDAQNLLLCLAPFTSVINTNQLEAYSARLKQHQFLAALPFAQWTKVIGEAQQWGLLLPDQRDPGFLHLHPVFPYFLRSRLQGVMQQEQRAGIERAFCQLYADIGDMLFRSLKSEEPNQRLLGQMQIQMEYENLLTALHLSLTAQISIWKIYAALSTYLDTTQEQQKGLALGEMVLNHLEGYSAELVESSLGSELAMVVNNIAKRQAELKRHEEAIASYKRALTLWEQAKGLEMRAKQGGKAAILYNLGRQAEELRQWQQAEHFYQQSLSIKQQWSEPHEQAGVYHSLGTMAQAQRRWEQAEHYYQQALLYGKRYKQADTYHQLGHLAQEQHQWEQAQQYYQQALQIYEEFQDRYEQAETYQQLGRLAQEQQQGEQARDYLLQSLQIFEESEDDPGRESTLRILAQLWNESRNAELAAEVAAKTKRTRKEVEEQFSHMLEDGS